MNSYPIERFTGTHSTQEMIGWAKKLRYFYLFGEFFSGQVDCKEELVLRINFSNKEDFIDKIQQLTFLNKAPRQLAPFQSVIYDFPEFLQPYFCQIIDCEINNSCCFINVGSGFFDISLFGNGNKGTYGLNDNTILDAQRIENQIDKLNFNSFINHEINKFFNCISVVNFPSEFQH
jgi:hypothetical protein